MADAGSRHAAGPSGGSGEPRPYARCFTTSIARRMAGFPKDFVWGATAAYQIEGAVTEEGRGESIWDRFSHTPGNVVNGDTGDVACDHFHRWQADVSIMAGLGLEAYRFSIAWPRIVPAGSGSTNPMGPDFYDRLVDELLANDIEPYPTLYHWDLPQALELDGGWTDRTTAEAFAEYAGVVAGRLGDRVTKWMTLNEPWVSATLGYELGVHAPGRRSLRNSLAASHHLLLGHGLAVEAIRAAASRAEVGIVLNFEPKHPATSDDRDRTEARVADALMNRWYLDPVTGRGYPHEGVAATGWDQAEIRSGDLESIAAPLDQLGVNYYRRAIVSSPMNSDEGPRSLRKDERVTDIGWEVYPDGISEILSWIWDTYGIGSMYVTENGAAYHDKQEGRYHDTDRIDFLRDHISQVEALVDRGVPVDGYFVWSLLDNFEWAWGYSQRFGIIHVDYATQRRTLRSSAHWYADLVSSGGLPAGPA